MDVAVVVIEDDAAVGTRVEVEAAAVAGVLVDLEALRDTLLRRRAFRRSLEERE